MTKSIPPCRGRRSICFRARRARGIYGAYSETSTLLINTGAILYLLIRAGYADDERVNKAIEWLLSVRQHDGGWFIGSPGMIKMTYKQQCELTADPKANTARDFDFSMPFSAAGTGMAIRAIAAHPQRRHSEEAMLSARLLKSKFFKQDNYAYLGTPEHWKRFNYPYWWNDALSALDMLSLIGVPKEDGI